MSVDNNVIFELLAEDRQMISYRPSFAKMVGSVTAALLLQQIIFRWKANGCKPFFKFKEPCSDECKAYKKGDSWCEELAFGRAEFDGALRLIGTKITAGKHSLYNWPRRVDFDSDEVYQKAVKLAIAHIVTYSTDVDHKTWYSINVELLVDAICHHSYTNVENRLQYTNVENRRSITETPRDPESSELSLSTEKDSESREVEIPKTSEANQKQGEGQLASQPSLFVSPDLKPTDQQSSVENPPVPTSGITGKKSDDDKISKRGRKPKTPTDPFFVFEQIDGRTVYTGPFKDMAKAQRHAAEHGTVTQQQAIPPGSTIRPVPKVVQPWDVLGEAIATHLFGAKDKAGINAVFGRVAPILHGDKRGGNCNGLIAYECERQSKDKADLDYAKLAADVAEFWKWHRRVKPSVTELKVCFKVIDAWQEWRGKQKPAFNMADYTIIEPDDYVSPTPAR